MFIGPVAKQASRALGLLLLTGLLLFPQAASGEWSVGLSADYFADMQGTNPISSFGVNAGRPSENYSFFISQSLLKRYYIYPAENEFDLSDTVFGVSHPLPNWIKSMSLAWSASASLPVSEYSRRNEVYTKPQLGLSASEGYMDGKLQFSYGTYCRLLLAKYQSEATGDGRGGRPLPMFSYGISHGGRYQFYQDLSASYSLAYNETTYHSLDPTATEAMTIVDLPDQTYAVSFTLGWSISTKWSASWGLTQGSQILHAGSTDLVLYDEDRSQWFLASRYSF